MSRLNEGAEPSFGIVSAAIAKTIDARLDGSRTDSRAITTLSESQSCEIPGS
ncbi:hypothetical protein [Rhizobium sp. SRDI969]|uniref:hypothetical protein n=1 Tax=Rhizobium sp. SRDI969 TaxID=3138252 RepID=UPI0021A60324|nr:hypothetical protein [Rhizobium leguminosarum]UWM80887.1 hypothetical protein N2A41_19745 [Rhizobium leguminosarum bv. viciae]